MPTFILERPHHADSSQFHRGLAHLDRPSNFLPILLGVAAASVGLLLFSNPTGMVGIALAAMVGAILLWRAVTLTIHDRTWLIFPLLLIELLISTPMLPDEIRPAVHYGLTALFCIPMLPAAWNARLLREGGFRLYLVYFGIAVASLFYSLAPGTSLTRLSSAVLTFAAIGGLAALVEDDDDIRRILWHALLACTVAVAINAVAALVLPGSLTWEVSAPDSVNPDVARFVGLLAGPNELGGLMLVAVGIALAYYHYVDRTVELVVVAGTVVCALGLAALADSRSPFVAVGIGIAAWMIRKYRLRGVLALGAGGAVLVGVLLLLGKDISSHVSGRDISTLTGRTNMWPFVVHKISERPIFGYGYDVAGEIFNNRYFPLWWGPWDEGPRSSLHNGYLDHAISLGIPAMLLWVYIMVRPWVPIVLGGEDKATPFLRIAFFLVIPLLIINLDESAIGDFRSAEGVIMGLVWALAESRRIGQQTSRQEAEHAPQQRWAFRQLG